MKSSSKLALMAAAGILVGGVSMGSAKAADLGGDCCADLEERVAELEATTARKGNRKMSLTVNGQVYGGQLQMGWTFSPLMFDAQEIEALSQAFSRAGSFRRARFS